MAYTKPEVCYFDYLEEGLFVGLIIPSNKQRMMHNGVYKVLSVDKDKVVLTFEGKIIPKEKV